MNYYGYEWDISSTRLLLDADLNTDNLGWKFGDYFKLIENFTVKIICFIGSIEAQNI